MGAEVRDPARIDRMIALLGEFWRRNPDLRLAQIVVVATGTDEPCPSVFYTEDDRVEAALTEMARRPRSPAPQKLTEGEAAAMCLASAFSEPCVTPGCGHRDGAHGCLPPAPCCVAGCECRAFTPESEP